LKRSNQLPSPYLRKYTSTLATFANNFNQVSTTSSFHQLVLVFKVKLMNVDQIDRPEYVEAYSFYYFLVENQIISKEQIEKDVTAANPPLVWLPPTKPLLTQRILRLI